MNFETNTRYIALDLNHVLDRTHRLQIDGHYFGIPVLFTRLTG